MTTPPLLRFAALGCLLFAAERFNAPTGPEASVVPVVLSAGMEQLVLGEVRDRLGRPPTAEEAAGALRHWEEESLLVADAKTLGLDVGDPIVRRRLAQKMRYLLDDAISTRPPTEADLEAHLAAHPERFQVPVRLALEHRFFDRGARGAALDTDARAALEGLRSGRDAPGDPHTVGPEVALGTQRQLADALGAPFARAVVEAPEGQWSGPYPSSRGLHLVRVTQREAARTARLEEMRSRVEAAWRLAERKANSRGQIDRLRDRHDLPPRRRP
ncbi:MAG: peptidylprolyl isomerase [Myxococcota bacterium]|nr:peptidylprolyl isomerase [Myxococcota bacterium]